MNEEPIWPETPRSKVLERLKEYAPMLSKNCRKEGNFASREMFIDKCTCSIYSIHKFSSSMNEMA